MTAVKQAARQLPLRVDSSQSSRVPSVRFGPLVLPPDPIPKLWSAGPKGRFDRSRPLMQLFRSAPPQDKKGRHREVVRNGC
jgi:hypothetical protein